MNRTVDDLLVREIVRAPRGPCRTVQVFLIFFKCKRRDFCAALLLKQAVLREGLFRWW